MTVGERIKQRRKEIGMSVEELSDILGKNRATVYRYESDDIENLSITILEPLAAALRTSPWYLMGWGDEDNNDAISDSESNTLVRYFSENEFDSFEITEIIKFSEFLKSKREEKQQ